MASITKRSQVPLSLLSEQTPEPMAKSSEEQLLSRQVWPEWAAAFPQTEAEILVSIWPVGSP